MRLIKIIFSGASLGHYEADVEESGPDMNHGKDGSWSDSESGFLHPPIKSKLKGLLGKKPFIYYVRMFWGYSRPPLNIM